MEVANIESHSQSQSPNQWTKFDEENGEQLNNDSSNQNLQLTTSTTAAAATKNNNNEQHDQKISSEPAIPAASSIATLEPSQVYQMVNSAKLDDPRSRSASPAKIPPPPIVPRSSVSPAKPPSSSSSSTTAANVNAVIAQKNVTISPLSPSHTSISMNDALASTISTSMNANNNLLNVSSKNAARESQSLNHSASSPSQLQNIQLKEMTSNLTASSTSVNKSFNNGDIIVSLLPLNKSCAWFLPAAFRPELVPEELMAQGLRLTVEDYVNAMQILVNDYRFKLYIILYKRILILMLAIGFLFLLLPIIYGFKGLALYAGGVAWFAINALGILFSMWCKIKLYHLLERCLAKVNEILIRNNLIVGVDDRGKLSCHKVNLVFIYFDLTYCIKYLNDMLENEQSIQANNVRENNVQSLNFSSTDINASDIIITGNSQTRVSQKEKYGEKLLLRYSQRWVKEYVRARIDLSVPLHGDGTTYSIPSSPLPPRHCTKARCPCQYIEEHLRFKPLTKCSFKELFI